MSTATTPAADLATLIAASAAATEAERAALVAFGQGSPEAHAAWLVSSAAHRAMVAAADAEVAS